MQDSLFFWCRDCEFKFAAESEHEEFEQATCKKCGEICMSFQFEFEEAERGYKAEKTAGRGVSSIMFALFGWLGVIASPTAQEAVEQPEIFSHMDGTYERPAVHSVSNKQRAEFLIRMLGDNGVIANLEESDDGRLLIIVEARDKNRSNRLITNLATDSVAG